MNKAYGAIPTDEQQIVYVREVQVADLPDDLREEIGDIETVFSVNRPDGARVALVRDRALAFTLARQHDLAPVNVH
jgi:hypothetical protein